MTTWVIILIVLWLAFAFGIGILVGKRLKEE